MATTFAEVLPVKQIESHRYSANFEEHWCIGTGQVEAEDCYSY